MGGPSRDGGCGCAPRPSESAASTAAVRIDIGHSQALQLEVLAGARDGAGFWSATAIIARRYFVLGDTSGYKHMDIMTLRDLLFILSRFINHYRRYFPYKLMLPFKKLHTHHQFLQVCAFTLGQTRNFLINSINTLQILPHQATIDAPLPTYMKDFGDSCMCFQQIPTWEGVSRVIIH